LINAAYGIAGTKIGKVGLQAGVRLEQAVTRFELETTNEAFKNDYFSVFPSAYATYEFTPTRSFKVSYSKRINRPRTGGWFNQLNPFNTNEDPYVRRVGNPYLQPEYVHSFEAGFTQLMGRSTLSLTPYFRRTVDVIRFIETIDDNSVTTVTFENLDTSDSWGAELIGTLQLGRRLNAFASFNAYKVVTDGSNVDSDLSNDAIGWASRANATINVTPALDVQLSYFYRAPMDIEGGRMDAHQMANIAVRHKLLNDRASLSLRMNDVFGTMGFHMWRDDDRFFQEINRSFNAQRIGLTFSYNFGQQRRQNRRLDGRWAYFQYASLPLVARLDLRNFSTGRDEKRIPAEPQQQGNS
jgi:outer membrane cobalamin receptor